MTSIYKNKKILAVASCGGHWKQLMYLREAFDGLQVHYLTTDRDLPRTVGIESFSIVSDCNKNRPLKTLLTSLQVMWVVIRQRPDIVITTGAAPGLLAIFWSRFVGSQTLWVDSIANARQLSLSGKIAKKLANTTYSQWENVADENEVQFAGSIL